MHYSLPPLGLLTVHTKKPLPTAPYPHINRNCMLVLQYEIHKLYLRNKRATSHPPCLTQPQKLTERPLQTLPAGKPWKETFTCASPVHFWNLSGIDTQLLVPSLISRAVCSLKVQHHDFLPVEGHSFLLQHIRRWQVHQFPSPQLIPLSFCLALLFLNSTNLDAGRESVGLSHDRLTIICKEQERKSKMELGTTRNPRTQRPRSRTMLPFVRTPGTGRT